VAGERRLRMRPSEISVQPLVTAASPPGDILSWLYPSFRVLPDRCVSRLWVRDPAPLSALASALRSSASSPRAWALQLKRRILSSTQVSLQSIPSVET
jgi:hypothetical protein